MKKFIFLMTLATVFVACGSPKVEEAPVVSDSTAVDTAAVVDSAAVAPVATSTVK
jgi:hypothetical protein